VLLLGSYAHPSRAASQGRIWSPEERALLTDGRQISALATTRDRVFVVTPLAVASYDPVAHAWHGPWQPDSPGLLASVRAALADPLDDALWMVLPAGWLRFDPAIQIWESGTLPDAVVDAAFDESAPAAGLFLRTASGWYQAQRGGVALPGAAPARPLRPLSPAQAIRQNPAIQALSATYLITPRGGRGGLTAVARADGFAGQGWYLGTSTTGLWYLADAAGRPESIEFGLPGPAAEAVFAGPGGVWVATGRTVGADPNLAFVAGDLGSFQWVLPPGAFGLSYSEAHRLVGQGSSLWIGSDQGVVRVRPADAGITRFDEGRGLPDGRIADLSQRRGRLVAGTAHGLASWSDSTGWISMAPSFTDEALAVLQGPDTVWVGTRRGLFYLPLHGEDLLQPAGLGQALSLQGTVAGLVWRGDTLVGLMHDRLLWRDPGGEFQLSPLFSAGLGTPRAIANGPGGLYVGGDRGVTRAGLSTAPGPVLSVPSDLPGAVRDLAVDDRYLWIATDRGLVRLQLGVLGP
jgi:hypothetical protein